MKAHHGRFPTMAVLAFFVLPGMSTVLRGQQKTISFERIEAAGGVGAAPAGGPSGTGVATYTISGRNITTGATISARVTLTFPSGPLTGSDTIVDGTPLRFTLTPSSVATFSATVDNLSTPDTDVFAVVNLDIGGNPACTGRTSASCSFQALSYRCDDDPCTFRNPAQVTRVSLNNATASIIGDVLFTTYFAAPPAGGIDHFEVVQVVQDITNTAVPKLPANWISAGVLELNVELKLPDGSNGGAGFKASSDGTFSFQPSPTLRIGWIPWCYAPPNAFGGKSCFGPGGIPAPASYDSMLRKIYPVAPGTANVIYTELPVPEETRTWKDNLIGHSEDFVAALRKLYDQSTEAQKYDQLIAWVPWDGADPVTGDSDPIHWWSGGHGHVTLVRRVYNEDFHHYDPEVVNPYIVAHEIGHNLGRLHVAKKSSSGLDCKDELGLLDRSDWPYRNSDIQEPGLDVMRMETIPSDFGDMMSYCGRRRGWISPWTYSKLMETNLQPKSNLRPPTASSGEQIVVSGFARRDGSGGRLDPVYRVSDDGASPTSLAGGTHCLRFSGSGGPLGDYCFLLTFENHESAEVLDREPFSLRVPLPAGTTRVALMAGNRELTALTASSAPPTVTITSPNAGDRWDGGRRTIAWSAVDPDGQPLVYTVLYSSNGRQSWLPIALDITDPQFSFDPAQINGGKDVFFRVMASDGLNSTTVDVGPIEVAQTPAIQLAASTLDFGTQSIGVTPEQTLGVSNTGNGPLIINTASVDNPAFTISSGQAPLVVPAGDTRNIGVQWDVTRDGPDTGVLTLNSTDPASPAVTVNLTGAGSSTGTPQIAVSSPALVFGSVAVGQKGTVNLTVTNGGTVALKVTGITATDPFAAASSQPITVQPGASATLSVLFLPAVTGPQTGALTLASNDPVRPSVTVALSGTGIAPVGPAIAVAPASLDFGDVSLGQTKVLQLGVSNFGGASLNVSNLRAAAAFSVVPPASAFTVAPGASNTVTVRFSPAAAGTQYGSLIIDSNDPVRASVSVPLSGNGGGSTAAGGQLAVTPDRLDFGPAAAGQTKDATVAIQNNGAATVNITGIVASGAFSLTGPKTLTVAPSATANVPVRFAPAATGVLTGNLTIETNDPARPSVTIPLTGAGTSSCTFTLGSPATSVPAASSGTTLDVTASAANCAWTNYSNADWIVITSGPGGTGTGRLAFSVAASPITAQRIGTLIIGGVIHTVTQAPGAANLAQTDVVVKIDGGTFRKTSSVPGIQTTTAYYVNRLTPPAYPAILKNVQIYFGDRADGLAVNAPITVVASTDPTGQPSINGLQYFRIPANVNALGDFSSYPMPSATINSGDFVAGFIATTPANIHPADIDGDSPSRQRSYISVDGAATFSTLDTLGQPGNFAIRATVSVPGSGTPGPDIAASPASLAFGNVVVGRSGTQTITISNNGNAPLSVTGVAAPAPFAVVSPAVPFTVAAGGSTAMGIGFSPTSAGAQNGTLIIANNDPVKGAITIPLTGTGAAPRIAVSPASLAFGNVAVGQSGTLTLTVSNNGTGTLNVTALTAVAPFAVVSPAAPFTIAAGANTLVSVSFSPASAGAQTGTLTIASDDPANARVAVPLTGTGTAAAAPSISVSPTSLDFGNVAVGQTADRTFTIGNTGTAPLIVQSLDVSESFFPIAAPATPFTVAPSGQQAITVRMRPAATGPQVGVVLMLCNDPVRSIVRVSLTGTGTASSSPQISVSPASLSFGNVTVGQSQQMSLTVSNRGTATLNVASLTAGAPFAVSPGTLTVAAGASATATVTFSPTSAGAQSGTLTIASNDPANASVTVPLTGAGVAGPSSNIIRTLVHHEITRLPRQYLFDNGWWPVLSANGNRAVFTDAPGPEPQRTNHIYVVNADGTGLTQVDSYLQECACGGIVDISADGSRVVSTEGQQLRIAGSGGARLLIRRPFINYVRITADGSRVFFVFTEGVPTPSDPTTERGVYAINADGSGLRQVAGATTIAAALRVTPDRVGVATNGPPLDISANGARVIFGAQANGQDHLFAVNADGSGLHELLPGITFMNHAVLSADGSKVGYHVIPPGAPNQMGVINFDGSGRRVLATNIGIGPTLSISGEGSSLLAGGTGRLYATDGSGAVQLSALGDGPAPLISDTLNRPTMNAAGNRVLYQTVDSTGIVQLVMMEVNPASLGSAPQIGNPGLSPGFVSVSGGTRSTLTATVSTPFPPQIVEAAILFNGLPEIGLPPFFLFDDGTAGDAVAADGVFTTDRLFANSSASPGAHTIRIKAEVKDGGGVRHATAIEFGALDVQP